MSHKVLISSLIVIVFSYGTDSETLHPDLVKYIGGHKLSDPQIVCFNKFWDLKLGYEGEERKRWNCPKDKGCDKGAECCAAYIVYDKTKDNQNIAECTNEMKVMITTIAVPQGLKEINTKCNPDFQYNSQKCKELESKLGTEPKASESGQNPTVANTTNPEPNPGPKATYGPKGTDPQPADKTTPPNTGFQLDFNLMLALIPVLMSLFFI